MYPDFIRPKEREIIDRIVKKVLADGHLISVYDGEAFAVRKSTDYEAITHAIAQTDFTSLNIRDASGQFLGSMSFVHGNDEDVIHDHTVGGYFDELFQIGITEP